MKKKRGFYNPILHPLKIFNSRRKVWKGWKSGHGIWYEVPYCAFHVRKWRSLRAFEQEYENTIVSAEEVKYVQTKVQRDINNYETIAAGAAATAKLMECMTAMSLKKSSGKPDKSVMTPRTTRTPHQYRSFFDDWSMTVKPNIFLCNYISMLWAGTAMGNKN